jgi:ribosomal protein S18 acetylase RimI-like enzyme
VSKFREGLGDETGRVIRHEWGWLEYRFAPARTCEIVNIEVDPEHRREGVGTSMIEELRDMPEVGTVYAFTRADNVNALRFYVKIGFTCFQIPGYYGDWEDGVLVVRTA